jgi:DNA-binding CsgD family transcriptional regulator
MPSFGNQTPANHLLEIFNDRIDSLTPREHDVMDLLAEAMIWKEIAAKLNISVQTASKHRVRVLEKLRVKNEVAMLKILWIVDPPMTDRVAL